MMLTPTEAFERINAFFHETMKEPPPDHSKDKLHCWSCEAATYAVLTPSWQQKVKPTFREDLKAAV